MISAIAKPSASVPVLLARDLVVMHGANMDDELSFADELMLDDTYWLTDTAVLTRIALETDDDGTVTVGPDTAVGQPGAIIHLDSCLTFMSPEGETSELLVMVEVDPLGNVSAVYGLPLAPLRPKTDYALVGIDREGARRKFAEVACVSFTRGTRITLASGQQRVIEELKVG